MMSDLLQKFLSEFLQKAVFSGCSFTVTENKVEKTIRINITTTDSVESGLLIGPEGEHLAVLEKLLNLILKKKTPDQDWRVALDVNNYRALYEEKLRDLARKAAHEVALTKKPWELPPMSAKDRRVVHLEIALRTDVVTESLGEEPERRIIIKPVEGQEEN